MINTLIFIIILFITVIVASKIVDSMIQSYMNHKIMKTGLCLIMFYATCLFGLIVIIGYSMGYSVAL